MEEMVNITIDTRKIRVPKNYTVLEAAKYANIEIPTLCFLKDINEIGACRMCVVEIKGARSLQAACVYPVSEGMEIFTQTPKVRESRKMTLELLLSNHEKKCLTCVRSRNCELQKLCEDLNIKDIRYEGEMTKRPVDQLSPAIVRDPNKCVLCRRCVNMCKNIQKVAVIDTNDRGFNTTVGPAFEKSLAEVPCINCGQCITVCPVGALRERDDTDKVWDALAKAKQGELFVIAQTAPAVRVALGEEFGMPIGSRVTSNMIASLRRLGFSKVFDTDTAADLTILEEVSELVGRIKNGGKLPLITSCSPGWIKFCEHNYPEFLDNLSTCKSPHEMFGAVLKSYYAEKMGIDPAKIFVVSIMPCTAKKFEAQRPELSATGYPDVDVVLTTRELARMIREAGIDFTELPERHFDDPMGEASGAGVIFGATGGVTEAALRYLVELLEGKPLEKVEFEAVRGLEGVKEVTLKVAGMEIKAAVAHGTGNAKKLLDRIKSGEAQYHFVEIMACPGGCVNGGGQPIQPSKVRSWIDLRAERAKAIYEEDQHLPIRKSQDNPFVKKLYEEYLEKPGSHKAHELLHTHYAPRENYPEG